MKKTILILIIVFLFVPRTEFSCTTAVISGKYTDDGRPMLWKLRDTDFHKNKMCYFRDGKYHYIGLINSKDVEGKEIWAGSNSEGFSIMNSASFNVNLDTKSKKTIQDQEGVFMKKALQSCRDLQAFEKLLRKTKKPMGLAAHFGVIDRFGNAAFYEVNNHQYRKFDANDPGLAPNGYIIRTNFSHTGKKDSGYGFIRYQTAQSIFHEADSRKKLNYRTVISEFSRCFRHPVLDEDFRKTYVGIPGGNHFINSGDLITRHGTASSILIQGIKRGDPKEMSTIWTTIGFPHTCVTLPLWVRGGVELPKLLTAEAAENSRLNQWALELKKHCYPIQRSSGYKYMQISALLNSDKTGILQQIEAFEQTIFRETEKRLIKWRKNEIPKREIEAYYRQLDQMVSTFYTDKLGVNHEK